jgi:hypothetical protein
MFFAVEPQTSGVHFSLQLQCLYGYNNAAGDDEAKMVAEGTKHAAEIGVITKADDIVCAVHAYKAGATKNVAMRFYYAGAAL